MRRLCAPRNDGPSMGFGQRRDVCVAHSSHPALVVRLREVAR